MSATSKGRRNERKAREAYERAGWWVYVPENASYGDNDLWNLFDLAAVDVRSSMIHFTQVKSNRAVDIRQWCNDTRPFDGARDVQCVFLVRHDRQGWRSFKPVRDTSATYQCQLDERSDDRIGPSRHTELSIGDGLTEWLS